MSDLKYRPEIDGLRSFAVLPVMFFHAGFSAFGGGYIGVDIFFVISGFLITTIIARELDEGHFSLLRFYERRARRILPALFFMVAVTTLFAWAWMLPSQLEDFAESLVSVAGFVSNMLFWKQDGYFDTDSELKPLLHTWSLAVEEQYYLLFPPLMMLIWRWKPKSALPIIMAIAAISLGWSEWASRHAPSANFYLLPSRTWELLAGAICALWMAGPKPPWLSDWQNKAGGMLAAIGFAALLSAILLFTPQTPTPSLMTAIPVIGTCLVLLFAQSETIIAKLLSWKPFVAVGLISYSAYLWHQPLLVFYRIKVLHQTTLGLLALLALTMLLAMISYRWVERPMRFSFLKGRGAWPYLRFSAAAIAIVLMVGAVIRLYPPPMAPSVIAGRYLPYGGEGIGWSFDNHRAATPQNPPLILYGDSHARHYFAALRDIADQKQRRLIFVGDYGCISLPGIASAQNGTVRPSCAGLFDRLRPHLGANKGLIIWSQFWGQSLADDKGKAIGSGPIGEDPVAEAALISAIDRFAAQEGARQTIVLIGSVPGTKHGGPALREGPMRCQQYVDSVCPAQLPRKGSALTAWNEQLRRLAVRHANIRYVDPYDRLCDAATCDLTTENSQNYWDFMHLTKAGAQRVLAELPL